MPCLLGSLPANHPLRNRPLAGAECRVFCWQGGDLAIPFALRDAGWMPRAWSKWRRVGDSWKIAGKCYNDLGPTWTENTEWRFPSTPPDHPND